MLRMIQRKASPMQQSTKIEWTDVVKRVTDGIHATSYRVVPREGKAKWVGVIQI